jgi:hypothetical protein
MKKNMIIYTTLSTPLSFGKKKFILPQKSITELPTKTKIYAEVLHSVAKEDSTFLEKFIERINKTLEENLKIGNWTKTKLILRFLFQLEQHSLFHFDNVLDLLEFFFSKTKEEKLSNDIKDTFAYLVISSLPWISRISKEFMDELEDYIDDRNKTKFLQVKGLSTNQFDFLKITWNYVKKTISIEKEEENFKPLNKFEVLVTNDDLKELKSFYKSSLNIKKQDYQFHTEESIYDILFLYNKHTPQDCIDGLLAILPPGDSKKNVEISIVDVIFSELFLLPDTNFNPMYYSSIIIGLCETSISFSTTIVEYICFFFENLDEMNGEVFLFNLFLRFVTGFVLFSPFIWNISISNGIGSLGSLCLQTKRNIQNKSIF